MKIETAKKSVGKKVWYSEGKSYAQKGTIEKIDKHLVLVRYEDTGILQATPEEDLTIRSTTIKTLEGIKMKTYTVIYRGKKVDEIKANDYWEAVTKADRNGYSLTMVNIVEVK